jgi:endonuclease YncB( thermonuclease family)
MEPGHYYNLITKRIIKNAPKDENICWGLEGYPVIGTREVVEAYSHQIQNPVFIKPFQNVACLCADAIAISRSAVQETRAVCGSGEILTGESCAKFGLFEHLSFDNIKTDAEVLRVIDGDTIEILLYVKLELLARKRNNNEFSVIVPEEHMGAGFYTKLCIRLYGLDTSEKQFDTGKKAKEIMIDKLASMNNLIIVHFIDQCRDKYGRSLAVIYSRDGEMLNTLFENHPELASSYDGGTKKTTRERFTEMPR